MALQSIHNTYDNGRFVGDEDAMKAQCVGTKLRRCSEQLTTKSDENAIAATAKYGVNLMPIGTRQPMATGIAVMLKRNAQKKFLQMVASPSLESCKNVTRSRKSERIRTASAASTVTLCPAPIAKPTSAVASAGESLLPSPTIATMFFFSLFSFWSFSTVLTLSAGRASATIFHFWMPTSLAITPAVVAWSPVHIQTSMPSCCILAMHCLA